MSTGHLAPAAMSAVVGGKTAFSFGRVGDGKQSSGKESRSIHGKKPRAARQQSCQTVQSNRGKNLSAQTRSIAKVATGKIIAAHSKRRRRVEFLDFMNSVTTAFPNRQLHVILDNLNTHKKNESWLKAHPNAQFHFRPTSASWLNQVEVWFPILQGQSLSGASFTNLKQLEQHIDAYINEYNDKVEPFVWTKGPSTPVQRPPYHSALIPGARAVSA